MTPSTRRFEKSVALLGILTIAVGSATVAWGAAGTLPLRIDGWTSHGDLVTISVANVSDETQRGVIVVHVVTQDGAIDGSAPVTVPEGQKVFISFSTPSPVRTVETRVIVDDGSPF